MQLICTFIYYYFLLTLNPREKDFWKKYGLNPKWRGNKEIRDISLSYKYAFNYNNFIIAPELRYGVGLSSAAQEVYDVKLHLGYDLSEKLAVLANVGFNSNNADFTRTHHNEREAIVYGIGLKYQLDERFNLEASIDIREKGVDIETTNFGISYNF